MHNPQLVEYLCVDKFLTTLSAGRALKSAFELGIIDLIDSAPQPCEQLHAQTECPASSLQLLLQLLMSAGVLTDTAAGHHLTAEFRQALRFRDLLEAKLDFSLAVTPDFADLFTVLLRNTDEFLSRANLFKLFDYGKCTQTTPSNYETTRHWMRFTSVLTRYETPVCLSYHDFSSYRRLLDIGGNSGEFARQLCLQHPDLQATVCDLPLVCDIGQQYVADTEQADRVVFFRANALEAALPDGHDIITFKSMLHDWPDEQASRLLNKAHDAVTPGGSLLIYERGPLELKASGLPFSLLPTLLFFPFYRSPHFYIEQFRSLGLCNINVHEFVLESPFFVVSGIKQ